MSGGEIPKGPSPFPLCPFPLPWELGLFGICLKKWERFSWMWFLLCGELWAGPKAQMEKEQRGSTKRHRIHFPRYSTEENSQLGARFCRCNYSVSALEPCSSLGAVPFCLDAVSSMEKDHPEPAAGLTSRGSCWELRAGAGTNVCRKRCCFSSPWQHLQKEPSGKQHIQS